MTAYTLDHPEVQAAKTKFERTRAHGNGYKTGKLGFDELFTLCSRLSTSLRAIAELDEITPPSMGLKYNTHFRQFFRDRSGTERRRARLLVRKTKKARRKSAL